MLRFSSTVGLMAVAAFVSAAALPERPTSDPDLFVSAGCSTCHGPAAAGALGPTLASTDLSFEAFLEQLRSPRGMMPPVAVSSVSDDQARSLFEYVQQLDEPEGGPVGGTACRRGHHGSGHHGHHGGQAGGQGHGQCAGGACRHGACARGDGAGG